VSGIRQQRPPSVGTIEGMTTTFRVVALAADVLDAVRSTGRDVSGNPVEPTTATGGEPLRCCLRDAVDGEQLILFGHEPTIPVSPFREIGAVFAHARPCPGPDTTGGYPPDWRGRPQVLRAYDQRGWIHPATRTHDGTDPEAVIDAILADPSVIELHSRNVAYGCFMFAIVR
jgi:hypothetical protein